MPTLEIIDTAHISVQTKSTEHFNDAMQRRELT